MPVASANPPATQQEAAMVSVGAILATIPEQGRVLAYDRSVQVEQEAGQRIAYRSGIVKTGLGGEANQWLL